MSSLQVKPRERSANIFINYRREDSAGHAGRLFDALSSHFAGRLFMDVDTLEPGVDFVEAIEQAVGSCEVLIVIIGREWLTIEDQAGRRRLDNPGDFVRLEVESALARKIRVIPVLVQDAPMPRAEELPESLVRLARRNAIELSDARWAYDVDRLARTIQDILEESPAPAPSPAPVVPAAAAKATGGKAWPLSLAALVLVAAVVLVSLAWTRRTPGGNGAPSPVPPANLEATPDPAGVAAIETPTASSDGPVTRAELPPARVPPVSAPIPKAEERAIPSGNELSASSTAADPRAESAPAPSLQPARATILSPQNGETVGSDVMVQGVVFGLGNQQIFLGIRQKDGAIYPRGELFPNADGQWSIKLRSSKEKTFEILVVASTSKEASQVLRDQRSRDDGLSVLPEGASISSSVVTLKKQGKLRSVLNSK
ncbi:MAG: TIR domain-containing protein [Thermoanaerobaculia bacterium]